MKNLTPVTREEKYLHAIATHGEVNIVPVTTEEKLLDSIVRDEPIAVNPKTRREYFLNEIVNSGQANKNYILKLEEVEFVANNDYLSGGISVSEDFSFGDMAGSILEIGGEKFLFTASEENGATGVSYEFTRDGAVPTDKPEEFASVSHDRIVVPGEDTTFSVSFECKISKYMTTFPVVLC